MCSSGYNEGLLEMSDLTLNAIELSRPRGRHVASFARTWARRSVMDKLLKTSMIKALLPHSWQSNERHIGLHKVRAQCSAIDKLLTPRAIKSIIASKQIINDRSNRSTMCHPTMKVHVGPSMTDAHLWNCMFMETLVTMQEAI